MALMIDPPSGWMYGFPKSIPKDVTNHLKWLVENGYPQEEIDKFDNDPFLCRYWETTKESEVEKL
mgnify:CR=1 FL=1